MIALSVLLAIGFFLLSLLSFPVRVRLESSLVCYINWLFVKVRIRSMQGGVKTELRLFNKKTRLFASREAPREEPTVPKQRKKGKKKRKIKVITREMVLTSIKDKAVKKGLRVLNRFMWRCLRSFKIKVLKCNIGLNDYYWQGILSGLLHSFPRTENLQLTGNFQERNDFVLVVHFSMLRLLFAAMVLLIRFPYIRSYLLYRRVYLLKD